MKTKCGSGTLRWTLLALLALSPVSVAAQQDDAREAPNPAVPEQVAAREQQAEDAPESARPVQLTELVGDNEEAAPDATGQPEAAQEPEETGPRTISGMSILGNQEAPTSLVIVPWRSSELGEGAGVSTVLDDSRQPVDKDVFMRALRYYEIRSESRP